MPVPTHTPLSQKSANGSSHAAAHTTDLARLLPLWPHELNDMTTNGRERRVGLLRKALRAERRRGLAGHWTYDLARHSALLRCYKREVELAHTTGTAQPSAITKARAG